ncbi:clostripain like caspase/hemoglobinase domain [Cryptosporidium ryanae]|uniref:clostripain like caspase/hemoglobinase domain n=1 Tax=Cryptosporidium ryanae TaxID=515981 RepID=UPI00351A7034|nr:clostripain like caspase/hemoglobinase domain [Cryptosporidium ryanae]
MIFKNVIITIKTVILLFLIVSYSCDESTFEKINNSDNIKDKVGMINNVDDFYNNKSELTVNNIRKNKEIENKKNVQEWMTEKERSYWNYHFIESDNSRLLEDYELICSSIDKNEVSKRRYWTHLIFIHADNNLESMSLVDLGEMTSPVQANSADYMHLVVYIDRCEDYTSKEVSAPIIACPESGLTNKVVSQDKIRQNFTGAYVLYRWRLREDLRVIFGKKFVWILLDDLGEVNSNSPAILSDFISKNLNMFPSFYTALTLWNHGSAWAGFGDDHDSSDGVGMFLDDMYKGIKEGIHKSNKTKNTSQSFKFDLIGFDACLMMQLDVLETMSGLANYILASEDNEPGHGWNFRSINPITKRGSKEDEIEIFEGGNEIINYRIATPLEYASRIVYGYSLHSDSYPLTLTVINTDLFKIFTYNLYNLFALLYNCGGESINNTIKKSIFNSRKIENCDFVSLCSCFDLGDMLEQLRSYLSGDFNVDVSVHELLALTLDSYYNMQVASVNLQEDEIIDDDYEDKYGRMTYYQGRIEDKDRSYPSRWTGISIYFPEFYNQVTCKKISLARKLGKNYIKNKTSKWSNIVADILSDKPGHKCSLGMEKQEFDYKVNNTDIDDYIVKPNKTIISYSKDLTELILISGMNENVLSSQTIITYPTNLSIGRLLPISLLSPTKISKNNIVSVNYKPLTYFEVSQVVFGDNENENSENIVKIISSNITLISGIEKDHYTSHFMYYDNISEINTDKGMMAFLTFYNNLTTSLYLSTSEGVVEKDKNNGNGFLIPIIYYTRIDPKKSSILDDFYSYLRVLYSKISKYINNISYPMIGINLLPRYDDILINSRKVNMIIAVQKDKIFQWGRLDNKELEILLTEKNAISNDGYENSLKVRVLINRYSETVDGYDELVTFGINSIDFNNSNMCKEEWIEDGICDIYCKDDNVDCDKILESRRDTEIVNSIENTTYNYFESKYVYVSCELGSEYVTCWKNSKCINTGVFHYDSHFNNEYRDIGVGNIINSIHRMEGKDIHKNYKGYCICDKGFKHKIVRLIDNINGNILYRHSCEDIDECSEQYKQYKTEKREQKEGDIYTGYNTNQAIYPTIERAREVSNILSSPFSLIKKHILTPNGLKRPCHPLAVCVNKIGGYECTCKPGYHGDGKNSCIQDNICKYGTYNESFDVKNENNDNTDDFYNAYKTTSNDTKNVQIKECPLGLHCVNEGYTNLKKSIVQDDSLLPRITDYCGCKQGYEYSTIKMKCVDINECERKENGDTTNMCSEDSVCRNTVGSYICLCPIGWIGNGYVCLPKEEERDIALNIQISGSYDKFIPFNYDNFKSIFKQSILDVLNDVREEYIEIANITLDQKKNVVNIIVHFKKGMRIKNDDNTDGIKHTNLEKSIYFMNELRNRTSNWYKSTYIGVNYGNVINSNGIKVSTVYIDKKVSIINRLLLSIMSEKLYLLINSSPYGKTTIILVLLTMLFWMAIISITIVVSIKIN